MTDTSTSPILQQLTGPFNLFLVMLGTLFVTKFLENRNFNWLTKHFPGKSEAASPESATDGLPGDFIFQLSPKRFFFSESEREFFPVLARIAQNYGLLTFPKVRLADLVEEAPGAPRQFERYGKMHVDYVLVNRHSFKILAGIELDGKSHRFALQQKRDRKKEAIFEAADIPLLHLQVEDFEKETKVKQLIEVALGEA